MFFDLLISLPAIIYYGTISLWRRLTVPKHVWRLCSPQGDALIIYVHGRNGSPVDMYPLADYIRTQVQVRYELFMDLPEHKNRTIEQSCKTMDHIMFMSSALRVGSRRVFIVGLSKGGLVAYNFLRLYGLDHFDKGSVHLITIGSPLQGAPLADYSPIPVDRENFSSKSKYILSKDTPIPLQCASLRSISCSNDHMVPRNRACFPQHIPSEHYHHEDVFCSHMGLPYNRAVQRQVAEWMK